MASGSRTHASVMHQAVEFGSSVSSEVNRHTVQYTGPVSMVLQRRLVYGRAAWPKSRSYTRTIGRERTGTAFEAVIC